LKLIPSTRKERKETGREGGREERNIDNDIYILILFFKIKEKILILGQVSVAHTYSPSYCETEIRSIMVQDQLEQKV
jgi:hypothetical protein